MVLARVSNVKSGWKSMFMVFTTAASDDEQTIVRLAFETIEKIVREHFQHITETVGAAACWAAGTDSSRLTREDLQRTFRSGGGIQCWRLLVLRAREARRRQLRAWHETVPVRGATPAAHHPVITRWAPDPGCAGDHHVHGLRELPDRVHQQPSLPGRRPQRHRLPALLRHEARRRHHR